MRSIAALLVSFSLVALSLVPAQAAADKTVSNLKGDVSYQSASGAPTPVALKATLSLADVFRTITGTNSEAAIGLPDSSRVLVGQNSNVQLSAFNQTGITSANFIVVGKVRFSVQHPAGAHASYTFTTGTAQIAVRGTTGDISWDPATQTLQVNCYDLSDPALPIQVTLSDGEVFNIGKGQSLVAHLPPNPADPPHVQNITHPLADNFSEFGAPANAKELGLLKPRPWFLAGGWIILIPIILVVTNHHPAPSDTGPTSGSFPVGVGIHIGPKP